MESCAPEDVQRTGRPRKTGGVAHDARVVPHGRLQLLAHRLEVAAFSRAEGTLGAGDRGVDGERIGGAKIALAADPRRHRVPGDAAENRGIGDAVAAQPVGAVHAARVLAGHEQSRERGRAIGGELDTAHHVMRGRHDLDTASGEIEAAIRAALDHALELAPHIVGAEVRHRQPDSAVRRGTSGAHLRIDSARDDVARRALAPWIVVLHEALARAIEKVTAGAAQPLL